MKNRLADAHHSLQILEDRLHEHNLLDENMANMLAKVRMQSEAELRRFKEESELMYQNGVGHLIEFNSCFINDALTSLRREVVLC